MKKYIQQFLKELFAIKPSEKIAFWLTIASYVPIIISAGDIVLLSFIYWIVLAIAVVRILKFHNLPYLLMFAYIIGDIIVCIVGLAQGGKISFYQSNEELILLSSGFAFFLSTWWYLESTGKGGNLPHFTNAVALQISYIPMIQGFIGPANTISGGIGIGIADLAMVVQLFWVADFIQNLKKTPKKAIIDNLIWLVGIINSSIVTILMIY